MAFFSLANLCGKKNKKQAEGFLTLKERAELLHIDVEKKTTENSHPPENFFSPSKPSETNDKRAFITLTEDEKTAGKNFILNKCFNLQSSKGIFDVVYSESTIFHQGKGYTPSEGGQTVHVTHIKLCKNKTPKCLVFNFHGLGSAFHIGSGFSMYFGENDIEVIGYDNPNFGKSSKSVGKYGPIGLVNSFQDLICNGFYFIEQFYDKYNQYKDIPFFLWGSSLGGATITALSIQIKTHWDKREDLMKKFKGVIMQSPAYSSTLKPSGVIGELLKCIAKVTPNIRYTKKPKVCSRIYETHERFTNSPYTGKGIKIGTGFQAILLGEYCEKNVQNFDVPSLFFIAEKDNIIHPLSIVNFYEKCKSNDKTMVVFADSLHSLTMEYSAKKQADYSIEWMLKRI